MSVISCLTLIIFMESRGEPIQTQHYVASVAIERAKNEHIGVCESMKKPRAYSWMWDGRKTRVDKKLQDSFNAIAQTEMKRPSLPGRLYFNERKLSKRYRTGYKPVVSGNLIFY